MITLFSFLFAKKKKRAKAQLIRFQIIKGSISLTWKLRCWFNHPAESFSPLPKCSSSDDIRSNHWVMSLTDIKSPSWRCRKKGRRGAESLDWSCHGEETVWHFLLLSQFWNPVGDSGSCVAARSLWLWDNLWELRECKNWIYSCRWRRS